MMSFPTLAPSNRRQRRLLFLASIGLLLVASVSVIELLATAWGHRPWSVARHGLRGGMNAAGVAPTFFYYIPLGVFVGLVVGLLLDSFKYVQGAVLTVATLLAVPVVFIPRGVFVEPLATSFGPNTVLTALLAAVVTLRIGGVTFDGIDADQREFPRIPALIFWLTAALAVFGLFEAHVVYRSPVVAVADGFGTQTFAFEGVVGTDAAAHLVGVIVLLPALRYFTTYERGLNAIMLGPKRSGKSAVFGGIHLYIRDNVDEGGAAATRVSRLRQSIESTQFPDPTPATLQPGGDGSGESQPMLLELPYSWGRFVPTRVRFSVVDYPGEALEDILAEVMEKATQQTQGGDAEIATDGGERESSDFDIPFSEGDDGDDDSDSAVQWGATDDGDDGDGRDGSPGSSSGVSSQTGSDSGGASGGTTSAGAAGSTYDDSGSDSPFGDSSGGLANASEASLFGDGDVTDDGPDIDPKSSWEAATQSIREAETLSDMIPGIRGCVHNADRIVLTLPLDDFVAPVIERGNVPAYLRDRVVTPEEYDDYRRSDIRTIEYDGLNYGVKGPTRDAVADYLGWYEAIQAIYPEKEVVIVGTMADWMLDDFKSHRESSAAPQADGYRAFCDYVRDEIVREQNPEITQIFGGATDPDPLYLLWYDIKNEDPAGTDELRINVRGPSSVLKGARQFMQRINQ
ncbi:DUF456 domain-containing protein [Halobellus salinus]|nr:DUF456 domain-containing protein [Halobellus salinus]